MQGHSHLEIAKYAVPCKSNPGTRVVIICALQPETYMFLLESDLISKQNRA